MAFVFNERYEPHVEALMRALFETLSEKDRRRYAAVEVEKLGFGAITYIASVLGCSRRTIEHGLAEIDDLPNDPAGDRVRQPGAGRKKRLPPTTSLKKT